MALGDYTVTAWANGTTPAINATNLAHLETKVDELDTALATTGTFTPELSFGGATTGITYAAQLGYYTRIANRIFFNFRITLTSKGSATGDAVISGLPFDCAGGSNYCPVTIRIAVISFADYPQGRIEISSKTISLHEVTNAGALTTLVDTNFADTSSIYVSGQYPIS